MKMRREGRAFRQRPRPTRSDTPRISELLQAHGIDPLTVVAQTGTSLAMIERAYLRFIPSAMN